MIYLIIGILILTILAVACCKNTSLFKRGYSFAESTFKEHNFKNAVIYLEGKLEESRTFGCYDDFEKGITRCMNETIGNQICKLDESEGGDWYFCYESYKFKDSLTDREILL